MSVAERLDRLQRRHRGAGFPIAVAYKLFDDAGTYLAAIITYYAFVSLFPILLLLSTVLGFLLQNNPDLQERLLHSALSEFPVIGTQLGEPKRLGGGIGGLVVGIVGAVYGGLGVGQAIQFASNTAWSVPRNKRPNPIKARGRSLLLLATMGLTVLITFVLSALGSSGGAFGEQIGLGLQVLFTLVAVVLNAGVFIVGFRLATARDLTVRQILPGALTAAVIWQLLQSFGGVYVGHVVKSASLINSVFALVLGLLAFLYLAALGVVVATEINVVRVNHLYPRALLTPFTDDVDLTSGDERTYTDAAKAQRTKGFQHIDVTFDGDRSSDADEPSPHAGDDVR
jgi:YihY family inner membrane protein